MNSSYIIRIPFGESHMLFNQIMSKELNLIKKQHKLNKQSQQIKKKTKIKSTENKKKNAKGDSESDTK